MSKQDEGVRPDSGSDAAEHARVRRQLLVKGGIAALAVAALVVALVMLESPHDEEPAPTAHTVTDTGIPASQVEAQSPSLADAATQALRNSSEAAQLQSVVMAEQQATASEAAAAPVVPEESVEPLGVPAQASAPTAAASPRRREAAGHLVLEQSPAKSAHVTASSSVAAVTKPLAIPPALPPKTSAVVASSAPAGDFFVQVGVFANPVNAEELRAKLKQAGIPTQVETRVQVGPFGSRQEALAAQAKLKSLGLEIGMVVPARH